MQNPSGGVPQPEAILEWLQQEMGYRPQGQYLSSNNPLPSPEDLKKICRGNMLPVWNFLLQRVKSEKTVEKIKRNVLVHGRPSVGAGLQETSRNNVRVKEEEVKSKGRRRFDGKNKGKTAEIPKSKEVLERGQASEAYEIREKALRERDAAEKEVERLRQILQRQRKELKGRMLETSREESQRKRMLDDKSNYRHKQVMLEAYDQRCEDTTKIFAEYQRRLHRYVDQARDAQKMRVGGAQDVTPDILRARNEQDTVYATVKGNKPTDGLILIETAQERSIRKACESLAAHLTERIRNTFPAYDGLGVQGLKYLEASKLGIDIDGEIPDDIKDIALNSLRSPPQLLRAITSYTARVVNLINRETEKIDVRADAERLRYKYENNRVMDATSPDGSSYSQSRSNGTYNQLRERQKAHVQQFMETEDALNKAAEARKVSEKLIKRMHGSDNGDAGYSYAVGDNIQSSGGLRQFELDVLSKERELVGLRASVNTLTSEVLRLKKMCAEWREAEEALRRKWKKIEQFDGRRTELESIYTALVRSNLAAAASWEQHPLAAREYSANTIIPACSTVQNKTTEAHDLIEKEVVAFHRSPENRLYMLPATPQALLDSMGVSGSTGPEAVAAAEKNAELLTARAGARDPSAIPSICRISAALQYHAGVEGSDAGLGSVLESLEFCLKLRGSEASILEDLSKAINQVHMLKDLVGSGRALLSNAYSSRPEYERTTSYCLSVAAEHEKIAMEKWLPELKAAVHEAQKCLQECKRVRGLVDEWWEQPAATAVDWVTVDGQNVAAWIAHVKQLQMAFY
ncbi:hypothetical protein SUGI_0394400 [Cryptomeria japonica]|uniref:AUGMIN subunit 5 isoform X2 n=1 Tax=Cryptomeria japonica TaxID=3369 RepID=UPI002408CEA5|nr:AUGMIN subunit 5 isoform X2 [Cryptomeria japonica]GLJ21418.1 hypothetical protein SUGI_0394400 [Cryptomeria japonica]